MIKLKVKGQNYKLKLKNKKLTGVNFNNFDF